MSLFQPFPMLQTARLRLVALRSEDVEGVFKLQSDPRVVRYFGRAPDRTLADSMRRIEEIVREVAQETAIRWGLRLSSSDELIGTAGFWRWNEPHHLAEIGYELSPDHWGQGLMPEALRAILQFGFARMKLHRVEANLDPNNQASARVLEKLGFVREGVLRENWFYDGVYTHTGTYGLLAREFI